jgi:hypothetical protein
VKNNPDWMPLPLSAIPYLHASMNNFFLRILALLLHAAANFLVVTWLLNFDITKKWLYFIGFVALLLALLYLFIRHITSFIYFLKTKTK